MWLSLNVVGSFVEIWVRAFSKIDLWNNITNQLSRGNYLRLLAVASLPLFLLAILSNVYFLSGNEQIGNEFIKRISNNSNYYTLFLLLALYTGAQVSIDYNRVAASKVDLAPLHGLKPERKEPKHRFGAKIKL